MSDSQNTSSRIALRSATLWVALAVLFLGGSLVAQVRDSLEYKLAVVEKGGYVREDDRSVARFRSLLSQLSRKYTETRQQVADMSVKARELLQEKGISQSILELMEGINTVHADRRTDVRYSKLVSTYIVSRDRGQSHAQTILALRIVFN